MPFAIRLLVLLGVARLAIAQRAVHIEPAGTTNITQYLNIELAVYTIYYCMMALVASYGAIFVFNLRVDWMTQASLIAKADAEKLAIGWSGLLIGLSSSLSLVIPIVRSYVAKDG